MERIASFTVDHTVLVPGLYLSRRDGTTVTFDLRFKKPNTGDLLSNAELHSVEHVIATLLRNSPQKDAVIYFGPMGCQTGFYFLFDGEKLSNANAVRLLQRVFTAAAKFAGAMPGASARECGNYRQPRRRARAALLRVLRGRDRRLERGKARLPRKISKKRRFPPGK